MKQPLQQGAEVDMEPHKKMLAGSAALPVCQLSTRQQHLE